MNHFVLAYLIMSAQAAEAPMTRAELATVGLLPRDSKLRLAQDDQVFDEVENETLNLDKKEQSQDVQNVQPVPIVQESRKLPFCRKATKLCVPRVRGACFCRGLK